MPHDDFPHSLKAPREDAALQAPALEVMARTLRLPTHSARQARAIVKMQLDRLSPVPVAETVYDLALVRTDGADGLFALGITRRAGLSGPAFANKRTVAVTRTVDGASVVFRFRNPDGVDDRERRLLLHAPKAAMIAAGVTAVLLAGAFKADQWREQRLPQLAGEQRQAAQAQRAADEQSGARADWIGLERADAASRLLCVMDRFKRVDGGQAVPVLSLEADAKQVSARATAGSSATTLARAGAKLAKGQGPEADATFGSEICG